MKQTERLPTKEERELFEKALPNCLLGSIIEQWKGEKVISVLPRYKRLDQWKHTSVYWPHQGKKECRRRSLRL